VKEFHPDVAIIGAGPAGSLTAKLLAEKEIDVLVLEKRREIGVPVQCAEYIPWQVTNYLDLKDVISQPIKDMITHLPNGEEVRTLARGFIVDRDRFDKKIAEEAKEKGAEFLLNTEVVEFDGERILAMQKQKPIRIKPRIFVGADGPRSLTSKWINSENKEFILGFQYTMPLRERMEDTHVFFSLDIPGGYGWLFPKGGVANVGIGVDLGFDVRPKSVLDKFTEDLTEKGLIARKIIRKTSGLIPVSGFKKICFENIILTGDAAGLTHPITGAGILSALQSGEFASNAIIRSLSIEDLEILSEFEQECRDLFYEYLTRAVERRRFLHEFWGKEELSSALKEAWVAFPGYYHR